ncbi:MAG: hypothetical protein PHC84_06250 [Clostridia bacterium]|nr:hypothetical protein [Clostridia bacterium]
MKKEKQTIIAPEKQPTPVKSEDTAAISEYFDKYYKAYKNDYISQYYKAYKDLKARSSSENK